MSRNSRNSGRKSGPIFPPLSAGRPTVALPPSASAGAEPSVRRGPSPAEIADALKKGGALYAAGRLREAEQVARLILRFEPRQPDALHLLGLAIHAQGNPAEAEKLISAAIAVARPHPNLFTNLGNAQRDQGKTDLAIASYAKALKLDATYADACQARGETFAAAGRFAEALADFERLISLRPRELLPYLKAATAASDAGRFREALVYCDRALANFDPVPTELLVMIAVAHERLTELDEAVAAATQALEREPQNGNALRVWARASRRLARRDPEALRRIRVRLESCDVEAMPVQEARVVYAELAILCDELGETDAAFDYFARQNAKTRAFLEQSAVPNEGFIEDLERLIAAFTPAFVRRWQPLPEPRAGERPAPVFLVGFPRSGTTLLDQILDAHPQVQVIEEKPLLGRLHEAAQKLEGGYPGALATLSPADRRRLQDIYLADLAAEGADLANRVVVNKMPLNIVQAGLLSRVFPDAKIILALRHPADSVLSCFMQDFVPNGAMANFLTLEGTARLYDRVMTLWRQYRECLPLNVVEVRYENLIRDIRAEVEPVLDFLGLPWSETQADPAAHALRRGTIRTPSYAQVTQPIYTSATDRWRRYGKYIAPVLPVLEKHIRYFGYSL